jgi:hypothetical protein
MPRSAAKSAGNRLIETRTKFRSPRPAISKLAETYGIEVPAWGDYRGGFEDKGVAIYIPPPEP